MNITNVAKLETLSLTHMFQTGRKNYLKFRTSTENQLSAVKKAMNPMSVHKNAALKLQETTSQTFFYHSTRGLIRV